MAEALGLVSSIVALVQLSASVYSATSKFYREAKEAKSKIGDLATQTRNLSGVLQSLSLLASSPLFDDAGVSVPDFRDTYIGSCQTTLHRIKRKLEKAECDFESGSHRKLLSRSLKWPFASQETNDLIVELSQHRDVLQLALSADTMSHLLQCLANTNSIAKSVDVLNRKLDKKESIDTRAELTAKREKVIQFFLKVNPEDHFQDCRRRRQPNTGNWLIERNEIFRNWITYPGSQIWLSGIPGAGKTILCGAVVDEILQEQTSVTAVAFFFCDYKYSESQNPVNVLATLAVQLAIQADAAFEVLESYHEELHPYNRIEKPPETKRMIEIVQAMINNYARVYLAVDGLDECGSNVAELLQSLKQLTQGNQVNMALFSRNEPDIMEELSDSPRIEIAAHTEDLELYVLAQMESRKRLGSLAVKNPELHEHIRRTLIEAANGMLFRWVACQLDHLDGLPSDSRRRKALTELPPTLFETYDRILDRIMEEDERDQRLCRKALHWIGLGYKNIGPLALCEAISIPDDQDLVDKELLVDPDWISRSCSSLIRLAGQESNYLHFQLAHFTVKEYLRSIKPQSNRSPFRFSEDEAIRNLTGTSLRFLTFPVFDRRPTIASSELQRMAQRNEQHPFYPFAAGYMFCSGGQYWEGIPAHDLSLLLENETMMRYAKELFSPDKTAIFHSWVLQVMWNWPIAPPEEDEFSSVIGLLLAPEFSTLHVAAMLAIPSICTHLIDAEKVDLNVGCRSGTPLHALLAGVSFLFPGGFRYNPGIHYRWHPKSSVVAYGQSRRCLEIFFKHCADTSLRWDGVSVFQMAINSSVHALHPEGKRWIEPLISPSTVVSEDCVQDFKDKLATGAIDESILDTIFTLGSTPEISSGWARLASLIQTRRLQEGEYERGDFQRDFQDRLSDEDFTDSIRISLEQNLTDTLRTLVQDSRFRPDTYLPDDDLTSIPILHFAIELGSLKSVELLLEAGCDPEMVDESDGWTSLHQCAFSDLGDATIITLLLKKGVIDLVKNRDGDTCWHIAAEEGDIPVLTSLIEMGCDTKQSLATTSSQGRTPLASAIINGEVESALLLLEHCHAELEPFQSDQSLLDKAAAIGSEDLFARLHEKLKEAEATEAISSSKPFENIGMSCSPRLLDYLLSSWDTRRIQSSNGLTHYLLEANSPFFKDPENYPSRLCMDHIIRVLLPPDHVFVDYEKTQTHFWEIFCDKVVPYFTNVCSHRESECRTALISMTFEILIDTGLLASYERNTRPLGTRILFRALLSRSNHLKCSWIAPSVHKVIEAHSLSRDLANEAVSIELLSQAVRESNINLVRELLDHGVGVHAAHESLSPLEQACYSSDLQVFQLLLEHSEKTLISGIGSQGKTPLHWVVSGKASGYLEKIEQLLQLGANIDSEVDDAAADTALTLASRTNRQDIVALLVSRGADFTHRGRDGWTVLHAAAETGDLRYIQPLISSKPPAPFWLGVCEFPLFSFKGEPHITEKTTAIHIAARNGRANFLRFMIQNQVPFDVDSVTGYPFVTPLHVASLFGQLEVVEILISSKANVNARSADGELAIELAAKGGHLEVIKMLLKIGSEKPSQRYAGMLARVMSKETDWIEDAENSEAMLQFYFENAIMRGDLDRCQELVAKGQSINAELLTCSYTPLVRAIVEGQTGIVDWLLSSGVEVMNAAFETLHPSLRGIAALCTHYVPSAQTLSTIMSLALEQNVSWYGGLLGPLHVAILDNKMEALDVILKHIRENDRAYRNIIETEMVLLPTDTGESNRSALSILVNQFNHKEADSNSSPWRQPIPPESPLHLAIRKDDIGAVRLLLQNEADVNQVDSSGRTPLVLAVLSRDPANLLRELLQVGAALAEPSPSRMEAMGLAIRNGDLEVVKILAEADPETLKGVDQFSANNLLRVAGSVEVFQYLVSQGTSPFSVMGFRPSAIGVHVHRTSSLSAYIFNSGLASQSAEEPLAQALTFAAFVGTSGSICFIKKLHRALSTSVFATIVNSTKYGTGSPLCLTASANAAEAMEALITMGAELDSEGCRYGSPLMAACAWGSLDVVRCLVRSGAALCYVNDDGLLRSAVSLSSRHQKVTRWLLVDRHVEQKKLEHQPSPITSLESVWSGPRLFKLALPVYMHRDFGESRWSHLRRLEKWKKSLLGATLAGSRKNSGLDFKAELEAESRKRNAQAAHHQFLARLGEV